MGASLEVALSFRSGLFRENEAWRLGTRGADLKVGATISRQWLCVALTFKSAPSGGLAQIEAGWRRASRYPLQAGAG